MVNLKTLNMEIKKGDLIIGINTILKAIKKKEVAKIYVSNDILYDLSEKLKKEADSSKIDIFNLDFNKEQLKELCKKPFFISAFAIKKGNEEKDMKEKEEIEFKEEKESKQKEKKAIKKESEKEPEEKEEKEKIKPEKIAKIQKEKISSKEEKKSKKSK